MHVEIPFDILAQPDDSSCGPTCLHAIYRHYGEDVALADVMSSVPRVSSGGTLAVLLGTDALRRGYQCVLYTFNLRVFDLTWFGLEADALVRKLDARREHVNDHATHEAIDAYRAFVEAGGEIRCEDLTVALLRKYLKRKQPLLAGLSATYLYGTSRELGDPMEYDDVRGDPQGHFVVLCGHDGKEREVIVADPFRPNPLSTGPRYGIDIDRLVCSLMLGIVTNDANLLVIRPRSRKPRARTLRGRPS